MEPTIGRIVHLRPGPHAAHLCTNGNGPDDPIPAVIVRVWSPETVNVRLLTDGSPGDHEWVTSVQHVDAAPEGSTSWEWPPRV